MSAERWSLSGRALVIAAIVASLGLTGIYLAAGGGDYEPTPVADPCAAREWTAPEGIDEVAQQFFLSALDGAACELGTSRETLAAALATEESRQEFAAERGIDDAELEAAVRAGVARAIDDAERAGVVSATVAGGLAAIAARLPVDEAIDLFDDAGSLLGDAAGLLDGLSNLLP